MQYLPGFLLLLLPFLYGFFKSIKMFTLHTCIRNLVKAKPNSVDLEANLYLNQCQCGLTYISLDYLELV